MSYGKSAIIFFVFLITFGINQSFPEPSLKDPANYPNYEKIVPKVFGDWGHIEPKNSIIVDPEMQANLDKIYTQTVSRTYVNSNNQAVMLSIAYGPDQRDGMHAHKPEACYPAQGFEIIKTNKDRFIYGEQSIPVKRLETLNGDRREFVTYWLLMSNQTYEGRIENKLIQFKTILFNGEIPDGMIFRVSSIAKNDSNQYRLHDQFVTSLLSKLGSSNSMYIIGKDPG